MPRAAGSAAFVAVDLGASSGRVMVARVAPGELELVEVNRFVNRPVRVGGTLYWDILALHAGILDGLRAAARRADRLASIGIDSWALDYGLLDERGALLGNPVHYRDGRTDGVIDEVLAAVSGQELYQVTGLQQLPINTAYQLVAAAGTPQLELARTMLMIPDLVTYWLTGHMGAERTNASTTQLYDVRKRTWADGLIRRLGIPARLFPPLHDPGTTVGAVLPQVLAELGLADRGAAATLPVVAVGTHDTASAVVAVPAAEDRFAYISCGTWSLVGAELDAPVLSDASRRANFTNESGVDGTIRYLRNVMGLWLLQESMRSWEAAGLSPAGLEPLVREAARQPAFAALIDVDDPIFLPPGEMPARIGEACRRTGQPPPQNRAATVRCILDSLALAYRRAVRQVQELTGREIEVIHVVGGGVRNELLCQLTADACGLPVHAGPVEAAAVGNVLVQARASGLVGPDLAAMRALVRATQELRTFLPRGNEAAWDAAADRLGDLAGRSRKANTKAHSHWA